MPEPSRHALAEYRLSKAEDCYSAAVCLLNDGLYADSASRSYFAVYHSARALFALEGVDFIGHSDVSSCFRQRFVNTGIFEAKYSDILMDAFTKRQGCDYEDFFLLSKADVSEQLGHARQFLNSVTEYLKQHGE